MGKLWDRLADEAVTMDEWVKNDSPTNRKNAHDGLRQHLQGRWHNLPYPYEKRLPGGREREILKDTMAVLRAAGVWCLRIDQSGKIHGGGQNMVLCPSSHTGLGDILACWEGRLVSLEVKAPGGRLSALQASILRDIQRAGGRGAVVVDPGRLLGWLIEGQTPTATIAGTIPVI